MNSGSAFLNPGCHPVATDEPCADAEHALTPPAWARDLAAEGVPLNAHGVTGRQSSNFCLATLRIPAAIDLAPDDLQHAVFEGYLNLWRFQQETGTGHPVRIWNYVPRILADAGDGQDRYMRFNAGRHRAFDQWFGGRSHFDRVLPAASAVGHAGLDLWIHLLASREPGIAVVNPRQRAPHRYSRRFGPLPPCFSRAMLVPASGGRKLLMVGGTASIRGEESMHVGNLAAQFDETTENLRAVATEAFAASAQSVLDCYTDLRIYHPRALDRDEINRHISSSFRSVRQVEWLQGDLCRSDLLVEIEALGINPTLT